NDGVGELNDGVGELNDGVGELNDGVGELNDGVGELNNAAEEAFPDDRITLCIFNKINYLQNTTGYCPCFAFPGTLI
ncbi:MAG: hypothetical protein LBL42_05200, partial [Tannerella sp.]|nr:hypothetical protein [Tannerella sp.]